MPESSLSCFVWYHAPEDCLPRLQDWMKKLSDTGISGRLLIRRTNDKTTFMEIFEPVDRLTIQTIESMAESEPVFATLQRRCEQFTPV